MKVIGVLYHPLKEPAYLLAKELDVFLKSRGVSVWLRSAWEWQSADTLMKNTDLVLSIGGDGTILRAAQAALPSGTPITGINLGRLGFMTELKVDEVKEGLTEILEGKGWIDERSMLEAELIKKEKAVPSKFYALNDVVVARGEIAHVVYITTDIDGQPLTTYKSDGVIVSTATGSTGYSLAAGGPILYPQSKDYLLLPLLPHLCLSYTVVLPPTATVHLEVGTLHQATFSVDGHVNEPLETGAKITVKQSQYAVRFLRVKPKGDFFKTLENKLRGNEK